MTSHVRTIAIVGFAAVCLVAVGCSSDPSPQEVVEGYFDAWNARDIDRVMDHVASDARLELDIGQYVSGEEEIRDAFATMFERSEWTIEVSGFETDGNAITYDYVISGPDGAVLETGRSGAVVEGGAIVEESVSLADG